MLEESIVRICRVNINPFQNLLNIKAMGKDSPLHQKRLNCQCRRHGSVPGQEDPLEKGMTAHSSILAWEIPWTEEPGGLQPWGHKETDTTQQLNNNNIKIQNAINKQ